MASVPVIDISSRNADAPQQLLTAASTYGFIYVENDAAGLSVDKIDHVFTLSKQFFNAPEEVKQRAAISSEKPGSNHGWLKQGVEKLDPSSQKNPDVKEALNVAVPLAADSIFPETLDPYRETILDFQRSCQALCERILSHLATALSIPQDWFSTRHDHARGASGTTFRLLHYPASAKPNQSVEDVRAGAHSDFGSITLLFQLPGQPGLEIKNADGTWSAVPVDPTDNLSKGKALPILVNIGDLLEDWTGGLLRSTVHRVVFPAESQAAGDRYSIAYFCHPLDDIVLEQVPSKIIQERENRTKRERIGMTAQQHLMNRLAATYTIKT